MIVRISGEFPDMEPVIQYFNSSFPNSILKEKHHNMLQYQLGSDVRLSAVFGQIEACRDELHIEDYSVSQTTLDQVSSRGHLERNFLHTRKVNLGPVVQSIVSLTTLLRRQLVKRMLTTLSYTCTLLFFLGKM